MNQMMPDNMPQAQPMPQGFGQVQQPQQQAPQQAPYEPKQEEITGGHRALDAVMDGLIKLVSKPNGDLTKKDVFDEVSDMIAHGAFPTPEAKQQLIGELANLPNDEDGIRKVLGQHLLQTATFRDHFHNAFGPPQAQGMPLGAQG